MNARHALLTVFVVSGAACGGAAAHPAGGGGAPAGAKVDITPVRDALSVYSDGKSHYVALIEPDPEQKPPEDLRFFYGDGKAFHAVPLYSYSSDGLKFEIGFNDARIPASPAGSVTREQGKVKLSCYGTDVDLQKLDDAAAKTMLGGATFYPNRTKWHPLALVKDGDKYLYVDISAGEERKYRVFSGKKGSMREIAVKDSKYDERENKFSFLTSEGTLVATRDDDVKTGYALGLAWEGKKPVFTTLERAENWRLIFEGLGIYDGRSPTPCDPMMP
jgi:hypothetical protein